jgi:MerR family transcriptional regulator, mercuric resistance operon regulatory protein
VAPSIRADSVPEALIDTLPADKCGRGLTPERGTAFTLGSMEATEFLTIGRLADVAGVHPETVRYYERRGLLREPPRSPGGYRQYGPDDVWRLQFIGRAKALGFTLAEVGALLAEGAVGDPEAVRDLARRKVAALEERQRELADVQGRLLRLLDICAEPGSDDCAALRVTN